MGARESERGRERGERDREKETLSSIAGIEHSTANTCDPLSIKTNYATNVHNMLTVPARCQTE